MRCLRRRRRRLRLRANAAPFFGCAGRRVLLVTPRSSYRIAPYLTAAASLGISARVASQGEHSLVEAVAGGLQLDFSDPDQALETLLEACHREPVDAVLATDDSTVELAARAAARLHLAHNAPEAAALSRRKDLARQCLAGAGLPVPPFRVIHPARLSDADVRAVGFPCVVKPLSLSGSRGVIRADDLDTLQRAVVRAAAIAARQSEPGDQAAGHLLLEGFIPGPELAVEGVLHQGRLQILAVFDKPDPLDGPYFEETYYVTPSRHSAEVLARVRARVGAACAAFGLRQGPVHAELRLHAGDAWLLELASRTIGGQCARLLRFGVPFGIEEMVLAQAVGCPVALPWRADSLGVLMLPIPERGILRRVEGVMDALAVPGIEDLEISVREGYELVPLPEGSAYLGFMFARGRTPAEVERALRAAHRCLRVVTAPILPVA